ncbi:MAG TPA: hypothetical protein VGZ51_07595 [Actinomycetota bacterium]|nr:hypothetical protein [Actinomycetota bacterium]
MRSESLWSERRWERYAPLAGVLAVILWVISILVIESADAPGDDAGAQEIAAYFESEGGKLLAGAFIFMVGTAVFIWFLGSLRARLFWAEGGAGRITSIVFGSGLVVAAMSMGLMAPQAAAGLMTEETDAAIDPGAAQALEALGDGFFVAGEATVFVFFLAITIAALRTRALPAWLGWASLVLALAAVVPWIGWAVFIFGLPLWVLVTSIWLFMRPGEPVRTEPMVGVG